MRSYVEKTAMLFDTAEEDQQFLVELALSTSFLLVGYNAIIMVTESLPFARPPRTKIL